MNEFLLLFRGGNSKNAGQSPEEMQKHMDKWTQWMQDLGKQGKFVAGQPLAAEGKTLKGTNKVLTDGPFAESKELVGGFIIVKADTIDDAVEISKDCPIYEYDGSVEVRQVLQRPSNN